MPDEQDITRDLKDQGRAAQAQAAREQLLLVRDANKSGRAGNDARETLAQKQNTQAENEILSKVRCAINSPHQVQSNNGNIAITIHNTDDAILTGGIATPANFPFRVLDASAGGVNKVKCYSNSYLYLNTDSDSDTGITDLTTAGTVILGNVVYLQIDQDATVTVTGVTRVAGSTWTGYPSMFHVDASDPDNPFVDEIYLLLAEIVAIADGRDGTILSGTSTLKCVQRWRENILTVADRDVNGYATNFPTTWA